MKTSIKSLKKFHKIMIYKMKVKNVNIKNQNKVMKKLLKQNKMFRKNLIIIRVT